MSLSLEVKKFVNSQYVGEFVDIVLPGKAPEIDRGTHADGKEGIPEAAQKRTNEAYSKGGAAIRAAKEIDRALQKVNEDAARAARELEECEKRERETVAAHESKEIELKAAENEYLTNKAASDKLAAELEIAESARKATEDAYNGQKAVVLSRQAELEAASKAVADAENAQTELKKQADTPKNGNQRNKANGTNPAGKGNKQDKTDGPDKAYKLPAPDTAPKGETAEVVRSAEALAVDTIVSGTVADEKASAETDTSGKINKTVESDAHLSLSERLERAKSTVETARAAERLIRTETETAKAVAESLKTALKAAENAVAARKTSFDAARSLTEAFEKTYNDKKIELEADNSRVTAAQAATRAARDEQKAVSERIERLKEKKRLTTEAQSRPERGTVVEEEEKAKRFQRILSTNENTARMHYMESGKGEPLILVHSAGQSLYTFRKLISKLAMNYRVIAVDLMGHGYSDRLDRFAYSITQHAECLISFMDAMGIEAAHFIGFSMGAGFVLELARLRPDRVNKLVLLCPGGVTSFMPLTVRMMESPLLGGIASYTYNMKTVSKLLSECVFDHTVINDHDIDECYRPASDPGARSAIRHTINGFSEEGMLSSLRDIEAPVLLLWGDADKWRPISGADIYISALRHCEYTPIRNAGHLFHEEKPDRIYELVRKFIPAGYDNNEG